MILLNHQREVISMTTEEMITYDRFVELGIATPEELNLAFHLVNGGWKETFEAVLWIREGYHSLDQMFEEEEEED
jgi:hypothetical protein